MPSVEMLDDHEGHFLSPGEVHARCIDEVQRGLLETHRQLEAGSPPSYNSDSVGAILLDTASKAVQIRDYRRTTAHVQMLLRLPDLPEKLLARARIELGSSRATVALHVALNAEQQEVLPKMSELKECSSPKGSPHSKQPALLQEVITVCEESKTPPGVWIDKYANHDPELRWQLYADYHLRMAQSSPGAFSHRQQLVECFRQSKPDIEVTLGAFSTLVEIGREALRDPYLADEHANFFDQTIHEWLDHLREDEYKIAERGWMAWQACLMEQARVPPREFVRGIDGLFKHILRTDNPELQGEIDITNPNTEPIMYRGYALLGEHAQYCAEQGRFGDAAIVANSIMDYDIRVHTLQDCLDKCERLEQVEKLGIDTQKVVAPQLDLHLRFTRAKLGGDVYALADIARECVQTVTGHRVAALRYIKSAYGVIAKQDEQHARTFGGELLVELREKGLSFRRVADLSKMLIGLGDPQEPHHAYEHIARSSASSSERLLCTWRLATWLSA